MFSFVGDTVLDPFVGSGTTIIAAMKKGRNSIGVDVDDSYLNIAKDRIDRCGLSVTITPGQDKSLRFDVLAKGEAISTIGGKESDEYPIVKKRKRK
jgi:cyclopropane fatty-acyl-phospholipid synthase-like methyltransferase